MIIRGTSATYAINTFYTSDLHNVPIPLHYDQVLSNKDFQEKILCWDLDSIPRTTDSRLLT